MKCHTISGDLVILLQLFIVVKRILHQQMNDLSGVSLNGTALDWKASASRDVLKTL
jgi:hypothetical protein